jgi:hypothetical protein
MTGAVVLDWRDARLHWAPKLARCRRCKNGRTHLRDDDGRPSHKVCAEAAVNARARAS